MKTNDAKAKNGHRTTDHRPRTSIPGDPTSSLGQPISDYGPHRPSGKKAMHTHDHWRQPARADEKVARRDGLNFASTLLPVPESFEEWITLKHGIRVGKELGDRLVLGTRVTSVDVGRRVANEGYQGDVIGRWSVVRGPMTEVRVRK